MTIAQRKLFEEALKLPKSAKAKLADRLISSMNDNELDEIQGAWLAEIKKRLADFKAGKVRLYSGDKVLAALKKKYQK